MKNKSILAGLLLAACHLAASAHDGDATSASTAIAPPDMPAQMEAGKAKIVPLAKMSPAVQKAARQQMAQIQSTGFDEVPEEVFIHGLNYSHRLRQEADIRDKIKTLLVPVTQDSVLGTYRYEGIIPNGPVRQGPWTNLIRVFQRPDGTIVMLQEWDYVADGGGIVMAREALNTRVGETPAHISRKRAPSGKVLTELSWADPRKYYTLSAWTDVRPGPAGQQKGDVAVAPTPGQADTALTVDEFHLIATQLARAAQTSR